MPGSQKVGAGARTRARELMVQALYQKQIAGHSTAELVAQYREDPAYDRVDQAFFDEAFPAYDGLTDDPNTGRNRAQDVYRAGDGTLLLGQTSFTTCVRNAPAGQPGASSFDFPSGGTPRGEGERLQWPQSHRRPRAP